MRRSGCHFLIPAALFAVQAVLRGVPVSSSTGQLAILSLGSIPSRLTLAIGAICLTVAGVVGLEITNTSGVDALKDWAASTYGGDLVIQSAGSRYRDSYKPLPSGLRSKVLAFARGASITERKTIYVPFRDSTITVIGVAPYADPDGTAGLNRPQNTLVSEQLARRFKLALGSTFTLDTVTGPVRFRVSAVRADFADPDGYMVVPISLLGSRFHVQGIDQLYLRVAHEDALNSFRDLLQRRLEPYQIVVISSSQMRTKFLSQFAQISGLIEALSTSILLLAGVGAAVSASALLAERKSDWRRMRILGATKREVAILTTCETGIWATFGSIAGVCGGLIAAYALLHDVPRSALGIPVPQHVPWLLVLWTIAAIVVSTSVTTHFAIRRFTTLP